MQMLLFWPHDHLEPDQLSTASPLESFLVRQAP